jgi:hypothetical protein
MENVKEFIDIKKLWYSVLFVIGAIVLPQLFHLAGWVGPAFLPMHIPVILSGIILGKKYGVITGIAAPILSTALTGMPVAFPVLPILILELGTYGLVAGYLSKETKLSILPTLLITMILGRLSYAIMFFGIKYLFMPEISNAISPISASITGLPGILIQILAIPVIVKMLSNKK